MPRLLSIWPALTFLLSGALLAGAHAFETFGGLAPCPLCLAQRDWHWGVVGVSAVAFMVNRFRPNFAPLTAVIVGLALLGAAGQALFHVAVEQHWITWQCSTAGVNLDNLDFNALGDGAVEVPACDKIAWQMLGISMAGYNAIISLLGALASFVVAGRKP